MTLRKPQDKQWMRVAFNWVLFGSFAAAMVSVLFVSVGENARTIAGGYFYGPLWSVIAVTLVYWPLVLASVGCAAWLVDDEADRARTQGSFIRTAMSFAVGFLFLRFVSQELLLHVSADDSGASGFESRLLVSALYGAMMARASVAAAKACFASAYEVDEEPPAPPSPLEPKED